MNELRRAQFSLSRLFAVVFIMCVLLAGLRLARQEGDVSISLIFVGILLAAPILGGIVGYCIGRSDGAALGFILGWLVILGFIVVTWVADAWPLSR